MFRLVLVSCAVTTACLGQQFVDPKNAKILKEQRFNSGDGRAGAAFSTENGQTFREETDVNGNRIGQYSYIGDDGKTYTVKYSAGIDGFRILEGDHIRATGVDAAAYDATLAQPQPQQQQPQQQPQRPLQQQQQQQQAPPQFIPQQQLQQPQQPDPNFNPFINPHDPTHRNFQFNRNAAAFNPNSPLAQQQNLVPACADCEGLNPFINPFDPSHQQAGGFLAGHQAGFGAGQQPIQPARRPVQPVQQQQAIPVFNTFSTTAAPRHFFPPGQLKLNRFETGFNFDFES